MKVTARIFVTIALLALVAFSPAFGQSTPPQNPPAAPPKQPGTAATTLPDLPGTPPVNAEEETAYKSFAEAKDHTLKAKLGEEFQEKYPASRYREMVFVTLSNAYQSLGQVEKMFAACEKAIEMNPDSVAALVTLVKALPRRIDTKALDAQQKLDKVEKYGKHALELIAALPKPENVTEELFVKNKNYALADVHSGLGLTYMHKQRIADSINELEQATKVSDQPDPVDFYVLGIVLQASKRFDDSAAAFGSCAAMPSQLQDDCKLRQADSKKQAAAKLATPPALPKP